MSIPIPLILALLAQKNNNISPSTQSNGVKTNAMVPVNRNNTPQINRGRNSGNMASRLSGVAQLIGGSRGAQIGNVARMVNSVNSISSPINALSLLTKSKMSSPINNLMSGSPISSLMSGGSAPNMNGASNIYNNINKMLSNMDKDKKDELLSMAQSIMGPDKK